MPNLKRGFGSVGSTLIILVAGTLFSFSTGIARATVGGPTVVYDLKFDPKTNSIYYTEGNSSGKGCPPELKAISLDTNTSKVIYSCDDGLGQYNYGSGQQEKIDYFTSGFSILNPINLRKNNITISADVIGTDKSEFDPASVMRIIYRVNIFQNGERKAGATLSGCRASQPVIIDGYIMPGVEDKMALLFSRKSDCFEGGYIGESMFVFSGLKVLDESPIYERKTHSPLVPHEGSLMIYAGEEQTTNSPVAKSIILASSVSVLLVGILLGRLTS